MGEGVRTNRTNPCIAILGGSAPAVILSSDNITSNCWPITPKEDDLAFIERLETTVSFACFELRLFVGPPCIPTDHLVVDG